MTIISWRIVHKRYIETAFDGEGARLYGGRWNDKGLKVIYTSATISLAALEMIAGLPTIKILDAYKCIPVEIPKGHIKKNDKLPNGWNNIPAGSPSKKVGSQWIQEGEYPVLSIPSVIIPSEMNYLINPVHSMYGDLKIGEPQEFKFDPGFGSTGGIRLESLYPV